MPKRSFIDKLKTFLLPLAISVGCIIYACFHYFAFLNPLKPYVSEALESVLPWLIFVMLFVSFCKVDIKQMKPHRWHLYLIVFQIIVCVLLVLIIRSYPTSIMALPLEGFLVCVITPTAAAAAVITGKLGGNESSLTSYMISSNVVSAIFIPFLFPLVTNTDKGFIAEFLLIVPKVFPIIVMPLFLAILVKYFIKPLHHFIITKCKDLAFYLWCLSLISVTGEALRSIVNSKETALVMWLLAGAGLVSCALQFGVGKIIGQKAGQRITAGQGLGQKNMVFGVWVALAYLSPAASIAPGCYVLWQNLVNGYQMWYRNILNDKRAKQGLPPYQE